MAPKNTATITRPRTFEQWRSAIKAAEADVHLSIKRFGEILVGAKDALSSTDWDRLEAELRLDHTKGELDAALAIGRGDLDERLFPAGVVHSKIMNMNRPNQDRLLSGERFPVFSDSSPHVEDAENLTWAEMSREQRGRLISDKGGRILPLKEQKPPKSGRTQRVQIYLGASVGNEQLTVRSGNREGRIDLTTLHHALTPAERQALIKALSE